MVFACRDSLFLALDQVIDGERVLTADTGLKRTIAEPSGERSTTRLLCVLNAPPAIAV